MADDVTFAGGIPSAEAIGQATLAYTAHPLTLAIFANMTAIGANGPKLMTMCSSICNAILLHVSDNLVFISTPIPTAIATGILTLDPTLMTTAMIAEWMATGSLAAPMALAISTAVIGYLATGVVFTVDVPTIPADSGLIGPGGFTGMLSPVLAAQIKANLVAGGANPVLASKLDVFCSGIADAIVLGIQTLGTGIVTPGSGTGTVMAL